MNGPDDRDQEAHHGKIEDELAVPQEDRQAEPQQHVCRREDGNADFASGESQPIHTVLSSTPRSVRPPPRPVTSGSMNRRGTAFLARRSRCLTTPNRLSRRVPNGIAPTV